MTRHYENSSRPLATIQLWNTIVHANEPRPIAGRNTVEVKLSPRGAIRKHAVRYWIAKGFKGTQLSGSKACEGQNSNYPNCTTSFFLLSFILFLLGVREDFPAFYNVPSLSPSLSCSRVIKPLWLQLGLMKPTAAVATYLRINVKAVEKLLLPVYLSQWHLNL